MTQLKSVPLSITYQGAKNSTTQSSLLLSTNSSKLREFSSTDAVGSAFSLDPPVSFPCNRSFRSVFTCTQSKYLAFFTHNEAQWR